MKTKKEILVAQCPFMDDLFLDYFGRTFRERIFKAMEEYALQVTESKEKELKMRTNDLLDALDLKEGNGPTALSMLSSRVKEVEKELSDFKALVKEYLIALKEVLEPIANKGNPTPAVMDMHEKLGNEVVKILNK